MERIKCNKTTILSILALAVSSVTIVLFFVKVTPQYAASLKRKNFEGKSLSSLLRGIVTAPKDFDYKEELANRYEA